MAWLYEKLKHLQKLVSLGFLPLFQKPNFGSIEPMIWQLTAEKCINLGVYNQSLTLFVYTHIIGDLQNPEITLTYRFTDAGELRNVRILVCYSLKEGCHGFMIMMLKHYNKKVPSW